MATGDGWTSQLLTNLAQHLEDNGVGVWRSDGSAYQAGEIAIQVRDMPQTPDRVITLAAYPVTSSRRLQDQTIGVQARIRGTTDWRVCEDIGNTLFELLHGAEHLTLGDIKTVQIWRQSYGQMGKDGNGRFEASHNYYIEAMRKTANLTE